MRSLKQAKKEIGKKIKRGFISPAGENGMYMNLTRSGSWCIDITKSGKICFCGNIPENYEKELYDVFKIKGGR